MEERPRLCSAVIETQTLLSRLPASIHQIPNHRCQNLLLEFLGGTSAHEQSTAKVCLLTCVCVPVIPHPSGRIPTGNLVCPGVRLHAYIHIIFKPPLRSDPDTFRSECAGEVVIPRSAWQPVQLYDHELWALLRRRPWLSLRLLDVSMPLGGVLLLSRGASGLARGGTHSPPHTYPKTQAYCGTLRLSSF